MHSIHLTDSHCHLDKLDLSIFQNDFSQLFIEGEKLSVKRYLCANIDIKNFSKVIEIAEKYKQVYASFGIHPCNDLSDEDELDFAQFIDKINHPKVIAIGETGLDYFHQDKNQVLFQHDRFIKHIEAAKTTGKALIIHMRNAKNHQKASNDLLTMIKDYGKGQVRGVMHCFAEDITIAKKALDLGFYISFSGIVSFKNAQNLHQVAQFVPSDAYLIETDSPWLAPEPFRGKKNYPHFVYYVAQALSRLRNCSIEQISSETEANFNRLFFNA